MSHRWQRRAPLGRVRTRRASLAVLVASGLLLAACGGGGGSGVTKSAVDGKIDVNAYDPFRFDVKTIKAPAGPLTIDLHEKGASEHTFTITDLKFEIKVTTAHPDASGTVTLVAGQTYSFKCSYDGHAAAGMVGKIVVG
jgi:plastocyanin